MARDYTKYSIEGIGDNLNKRQLVFNIIKDYIEKHNPTFETLLSVFPDEIQGSKGVIRKEGEVADEKRFDIKHSLNITNGTQIVVSNQWGGDNIPKFIELAEKLGYLIKSIIVEESNTESSNLEINEIIIGKQIWMDKNLSVESFRNGDAIREVKTDDEWEKAQENGEPVWCYYENDLIIGEKYGKIYNGFAVSDSRGLAPKGWHIPSEAEWEQLVKFLGGKLAGIKLKSTDDWDKHPIEIAQRNGTNESGFNGLPGGYRNSNGSFGGIKRDLSLWSSTDSFNSLRTADMSWMESSLIISSLSKGYGIYVRCLKD